MTNPFSSILKKDNNELKKWLKDYLTEKSSYPQLPPKGNNDPSSYLVSWHRKKSEQDNARRFGDIAFELLQDSYNHQEIQPPKGNSILLFGLLGLLQSLPTSNPHEVTTYLDKNFRRERFYVKWPDANKDFHAMILLAIANQIKIYGRESNRWFEIIEKEELKKYTVASSYILSRLSIEKVIEILPLMLNLLRQQKIPTNNLLFDLTLRIGDVPYQWKKIINILDNSDYSIEIEYLFRSIKNLGYSKSNNIFVTFFAVDSNFANNNYLRQFWDRQKDKKELIQQKSISSGLIGILDWIIPDLGNLGEQTLLKSQDFFEYLLHTINNDEDIVKAANKTGKVLAETYNKISDKKFKLIWTGILLATQNKNYVQSFRILFPNYVIKGYAKYLYQNHWKKVEIKESLKIINSLADHKLTENAHELDAKWLHLRMMEDRNIAIYKYISIGKSIFHEDVILTELFYKIITTYCSINSIKENVKWGHTRFFQGNESKEVNIFVCNENIADKGRFVRNDKGDKIFEFSGYYLFCRRDWLEKLHFKSDLANNIKNILLKYPVSNEERNSKLINVFKNTKKLLEKEKKIEVLKIIAGISQLTPPSCDPETDFQTVIQLVKKHSEILELNSANPSATKTDLQKSEQQENNFDFDRNYIDFVSGKEKTYLGGSVHSAIIKRWWINAPDIMQNPIIELFNPDDLKSLIKEEKFLPCKNYLFFGDNLVGQDEHLMEIKNSINKIYINIAEAIKNLLARYVKNKQNKEYQNVVYYMLKLLMENSEKKQWTFLTHPEDLVHILSNDDQFFAEQLTERKKRLENLI